MTDMSRSNLNLLVALDALLSEAHVSRAARRLGVTQSAMSHSLRQLREWLGDPLLVRGRSGLVRTPRAEQLALALRRGLSELEHGLKPPTFDPALSTRRFVLSAADHLALYTVPALFNVLRSTAPQVDLVVRPLEPARVAEQLELGELDCAFAIGAPALPGLRTRSISTDDFLCVVRRAHPLIRRRPTLAQYARALHVVHSPTGAGPSRVDELLKAHGLTRRVALRLPSMLAAPLIVAQTELVFTGPRSFVDGFVHALDLRTFAPPVDLGSFDIQLLWHERFDRDPANVWLRQALVAASKQTPKAPPSSFAS